MRFQHCTGVPCIVAGCDMQDVTGLPPHLGGRGKTDTPDRATDAARIETVAAEQAPVMHLRGSRQHAVIGGDAGQRAQLLLPLAQGRYRGSIDIDALEQRARAVADQPGIDLAAETAVVRVLAITQREQGELQARQVHALCEQQPRSASRRIRWFAIAESAQHEQRMRSTPQLRGVNASQWQHLHRVPGGLQLRGCAPGQLLAQPALAGVRHKPGCVAAIASGYRQRLAKPTRGALAAAAVQVEHPAGDEEQAHAQAAEHHHHAPGHAEVAARVQREHAGGQLSTGALACIRAGIEDRTAGRVQLQQVMCAIVVAAALRRITGHHAHIERLPGLLRQAQVDVPVARAR